MNWRAKPLVSYPVIVDPIGATTTETGLTVRCELDTGRYPKGIAVTDQEMAEIDLHLTGFHGEWNYTIKLTRTAQIERLIADRPLAAGRPVSTCREQRRA